jgi:hypothetical protein
MSSWLAEILLRNKPGPIPSVIRRFSTVDATLSRDNVTVDGNAWLVEAAEDQVVVRLFEIAARDAEVEQCLLTYRAALRSEELKGRAFLEMWCRLPGRGEFFSRGLNQPLKGTTEWTSHEIPFRLKKGQRPDLIKLNLAVEGRGTVWIKDIELLKTAR